MKKVFYILFAIVLLPVYISCSDDENNYNDEYKSVSKEEIEHWIIGKWLPSPVDKSIVYYEFKTSTSLSEKIKTSSKIYQCGYELIEMTINEEKKFLQERKLTMIDFFDFLLSEGIALSMDEDMTEEDMRKETIKFYDQKIINLNKQKANSIYIRITSTEGRGMYYKVLMVTPDILELYELDTNHSVRFMRAI